MNAIYNHLHTSTNTTEHFRNLEELLCRRHQVIQTRSMLFLWMRKLEFL